MYINYILFYFFFIFSDALKINYQSYSKVRSIINEQEIKSFLLKENFTFIRFHELSFIDQIYYFNNADYIVGLHGGGFANMAFCKPETKILEFRMEKAGTVIENLAKKNNLNYDSIILKLDDPNYDKQSGHIKIPLNMVKEKVKNV